MKNKLFITSILLSLVLLLTSCYTPSPLYGTWADNAGNTVKFFDDGTFSAVIHREENKTSNYGGNYSVIDNVLVFNINDPITYQRNTEWDIRGAMLYLIWTDEEGKIYNLTLYHTAR